MDIDALIEQLRRGDPNAGPFLVSMVAPRLLGYAAHLCRDLSDADHEQIVEKAIEHAIERIDTFDPERGTFTGWARTFVRNAAKTWRRQHPGIALPLNDEADVGSIDDGPHDEILDIASSSRSAALTSLVLSLPEPSQLLLRLRHTEGLDHNAIATELGVRPEAARKRLERVHRALREQAANDPDLKYLVGE